jgi:hypothetical protein
MRITLDGDKTVAGLWIGYARAKLRALIESMAPGETSASRRIELDGVSIHVRVSDGAEFVHIVAREGEFIIVCFVGDTTGDFSSKRFYNDRGQEIARDEVGAPGMAPGWSLVDDGLYGLNSFPPDPLDPWNNDYVYNPGGLGVPSNGSGISAKKLAGKSGRYILNASIEDEAWQGWTWTTVDEFSANPYIYNFVQQVDSLICAPYSYYGPKPYFTRYLGDKIVSMIVPWSGYSTTFTWDAYYTQEIESFLDVLPKVRKAWIVDIATGVRTGVSVPDYGDGADALSAAAPFLEDGSLKVRMVHANTFIFNVFELEAEPFRTEVLDMETGFTAAGVVYPRCPDPLSFYRDPYASLGEISEDARLIFGISETGKQTYIRIRKYNDFDPVNIGLYCGDELVEESGPASPIRLAEADVFGPIIVHPVRYRIIQAHQQDGFNAVVYSKTVVESYTSEKIDYSTTNPVPALRNQIRKTMILSKTTYHVSVNGVITDLGYSNRKREYKLTITPDAPVLPYPPQIGGGIQDLPWVDANYNEAGAYLNEDNAVVMRCDINASKGRLFLGFDVYPLAFKHNLSLSFPDNYLLAEYDSGAFVFPPSSDSSYAVVKDRKWMLFGSSGAKIREIQPPQKPNSGGHVNRINGLAFLGA